MHYLSRITKSKHFKKGIIVTFFTVSAIVWLGYWIAGKYYASTDDAYINANVIEIAPRIAGKVSKVYITNNDFVKKDQLLFELDPEPFQVTVNSFQAQLALNTAELENTILTKNRTLALVAKKYASPQAADDAIENYKIAVAKVDYAKAMLAEANLKLSYTKVTAPATGWVANVSLRAGDIVSMNQPVFALISNEEFWADANFKETELEHIKPGQTATIVTDVYPNHTFNAVVESISGGAGSAFSLLPPQNATGNWVKVTQRVPVRVRILNQDALYPLRIGISANVTVNLHDFITAQSKGDS